MGPPISGGRPARCSDAVSRGNTDARQVEAPTWRWSDPASPGRRTRSAGGRPCPARPCAATVGGRRCSCTGRRLPGRQQPADGLSAEYVEDHVQVTPTPKTGPSNLGDVPGPDLVGPRGDELRALVRRVTAHVATLANGLLRPQDAVHRRDRREVRAFLQQRGVDLTGDASTNRGAHRTARTSARSVADSARGLAGRFTTALGRR
jgi:hypothetical protein